VRGVAVLLAMVRVAYRDDLIREIAETA